MAEEKDDSVIIIEDGDDLFDIDDELEPKEEAAEKPKKEAPKKQNKALLYIKQHRYHILFGLSLLSLDSL